MKNLMKFSFMAVMMTGLLFTTSCGDDDEPVIENPTMIITTTPSANADGVVEVEVGEELAITVVASTPAGFNTIRISNGTTVLGEQTRTDLGLDVTDLAGTADFLIALTGEAGATATLTVTVVDEASSATEDIEVLLVFTGTPITAKEVVLLAAPTDDNGADPAGVRNSDTFYSTDLNIVYSMDDVLGSTDPLSANIDFGYYYGTDNMASLVSPNSYPFEYGQAAWSTRHATLFRPSTMSVDDFDAIIKEEEIAAEFDVSSSGEAELMSELSAGDIVSFRTSSDKTGGSKFGLIKVVSITGTDGSDGRINLEVLVEQ